VLPQERREATGAPAADCSLGSTQTEIQATGDALLARIKELAEGCPPLYIENLAAAYATLVHVTRNKAD
jgi:hypothetical protein